MKYLVENQDQKLIAEWLELNAMPGRVAPVTEELRAALQRSEAIGDTVEQRLERIEAQLEKLVEKLWQP